MINSIIKKEAKYVKVVVVLSIDFNALVEILILILLNNQYFKQRVIFLDSDI